MTGIIVCYLFILMLSIILFVTYMYIGFEYNDEYAIFGIILGFLLICLLAVVFGFAYCDIYKRKIKDIRVVDKEYTVCLNPSEIEVEGVKYVVCLKKE